MKKLIEFLNSNAIAYFLPCADRLEIGCSITVPEKVFEMLKGNYSTMYVLNGYLVIYVKPEFALS